MKPWPLEKIPCLGERAVTAIVQSIAQTEAGRHGMPGFVSCPPQDFSALRWRDSGLGPEGMASVVRQCNAMFHASLAPPKAGEECGRLPLRILETWRDSPRVITFFTSGSTGKPKPCTHPESHLRQEITSLAPLVDGCASALVTAPLHHMYGFTFGLLLPLSLGIPVRCVPPLPTLAQAQMKPGDMVVGTPLLWSRLADLRGWKERVSEEGKGITALTATAPMPPDVAHALLRQGFRVIEFFGSSEVGVVCRRFHPDEPFELLPHISRGKGPHADMLERCLPEGECRRYPVQDVITWLDERRLLPCGRIDAAVQVGGVNVYPGHVAAILEEHEGVRLCQVRLMRPEEGHRLKAFVVPATGWTVDALRESLAVHVRKRLKGPERPTRFSFGEDIPRGPVGKPADW